MSTVRYPPSFTAAKLYERTSAKGNIYMTGRLGGVRVTLIKSRETDDTGNAIWELKFAEAPAPKPRDHAGDQAEAEAAPKTRSRANHQAPLERPTRALIDDPIPF